MFRVHRVWSTLQPQRPRHPLLRALFGLFAICALLVVLAIGAVIGAIVFAGSLVLRMLRPAAPAERMQESSSTVDNDVIDGEFSVLRKPLQRVSDH